MPRFIFSFAPCVFLYVFISFKSFHVYFNNQHSGDMLRDEFKVFGEVGDVYLPRDFHTNRPRCVHYSNNSKVVQCLVWVYNVCGCIHLYIDVVGHSFVVNRLSFISFYFCHWFHYLLLMLDCLLSLTVSLLLVVVVVVAVEGLRLFAS